MGTVCKVMGVLFILFVASVWLLFDGMTPIQPPGTVTDAEIQQILNEIPVGSRLSHVEQVFRARHISLDVDDDSRIAYANFPKSSVGIGMFADTGIEFTFNAKHRLKNYKVTQTITGL